MSAPSETSRRVLPAAALPWLVTALTLAIFALALAWVGTDLRTQLQRQIAGRDAEVLHAIALMQQLISSAGETGGQADPAEQFEQILTTSELQGVVKSLSGVLAVRLFSPTGHFIVASEPDVSEGSLQVSDLARLKSLKPVSHYYPRAVPGDLFLTAEPSDKRAFPLLEVNIPLEAKNRPGLAGIAQFLLEGQSMKAEFASLDRNLWRQALVTFLLGSLIIGSALGLAFQRLQRSNRLLAQRSASLLKANQELLMAAKTSAVGAVTSHLIHGLKNPLSGLRSYVTSRNGTNKSDTEWLEAIATTERMHCLIAEIVQLLQDDQAGTRYELTTGELSEALRAKANTVAGQANVRFVQRVRGEAQLSNREANLILLILENLIANAVQATPAGKRVELRLVAERGNLVCDVEDEGPGLPAVVRQNLFAPCRSEKAGGSGIGLALSRQLAQHLRGSLELVESTSSGTLFRLTVPAQAGEPSLVEHRHNLSEATVAM